ncbi:sigma-70 family RNA polymerase sigma factor [Streptomyces durbertensis]|uniref:Sigma-70 family RNA polymerase sigma factor n=1 Tax=Streptomyces durbertensis TaxID=2448886 RepID=A0ABR6ECU2_9ACTN|nr:sigma-70 family RNA polymerase sigma factor [Streptomyces durbertensis]
MAGWEQFEAAYRAFYLPVLRFVRRRLPPHLSEDVVAETFVIAWHRWGERRGETLPWLYGIARRVAANARRAQERAGELEGRLRAQRPDDVTPAAEAHALERAKAVRVLAGLPERDREVLMLVSWDGLEPQTAARVMGCSRGAFLVRLHRARRRLEQAIAEDDSRGVVGEGPSCGKGACDEQGHTAGAGAAASQR